MKHNRQFILTALLLPVLLSSCISQVGKDKVVAKRYFHKYGVEILEKDFSRHGGTGHMVVRYRDGREETSHFLDGKLHGLKEVTYPYSDEIASSEEYDKGQLISKTEHYLNGSPFKRVTYKEDHQESMQWYLNGSPQSKETWIDHKLIEGVYFDKNHNELSAIHEGKGQQLEFDQQQRLRARVDFEEGLKVKAECYHPNGILSAKLQYVDNLPDGVEYFYDLNGHLSKQQSWKSGKLHGESIEFKDQQPSLVKNYQDGFLQGVELTYKKGELMEKRNWSQDKLHGKHEIFVEGKIVKTFYYYEGMAVSELAFENLSKRVN